MASSGVEAVERAQTGITHRHVLPPFPPGTGGATQIGPKRAFQVKLGNGLTSSRVATTFTVHAGLIVHRRLSLIFMAMGAPQAHAKLGNYPENGFEESDPVLAIWSCGRGGRRERVGVSRASSHRRIVARNGSTATPAKASG